MSAVLVFSYVAFDVLDLDLSDFPLSERMLIITEAPKATEMVNTVNWNGFQIVPSLLQPSLFKESIRIHQKNILRVSRFRELVYFSTGLLSRSLPLQTRLLLREAPLPIACYLEILFLNGM